MLIRPSEKKTCLLFTCDAVTVKEIEKKYLLCHLKLITPDTSRDLIIARLYHRAVQRTRLECQILYRSIDEIRVETRYAVISSLDLRGMENARAFGIYVAVLAFAFFLAANGRKVARIPRARCPPAVSRVSETKRGISRACPCHICVKGAPPPGLSFSLPSERSRSPPLFFFFLAEREEEGGWGVRRGRDPSLRLPFSFSPRGRKPTFGRACARVWPG